MSIKINRDNLIIAMAKACCSSSDLQRKAGLSAATISRIKKGVQTPSLKSIGKLARALGIDPSELIKTEQEKQR